MPEPTTVTVDELVLMIGALTVKKELAEKNLAAKTDECAKLQKRLEELEAADSARLQQELAAQSAKRIAKAEQLLTVEVPEKPPEVTPEVATEAAAPQP